MLYTCSTPSVMLMKKAWSNIRVLVTEFLSTKSIMTIHFNFVVAILTIAYIHPNNYGGHNLTSMCKHWVC